MRLKSFYGKTISETMTKVKQELGKDAVIISTEQDGPDSFHITTAIEQESLKQVSSQNAIRDQILENTHYLFNTQKIPFESIQKIINEIEPYIENNLENTLEKFFSDKLLPNKPPCKIDYLIGNHGAGKTLSVMKLATALHLQGQSLCVITTDLEKFGTTEQLDSVTKMLNIDLTAVEDHHALLAAIELNQDKDKIIIDTGGLNPYHSTHLNITKNLQASKFDINTIFVTQANIDPFELAETLAELSQITIDSICFTKIDLCKRYAAILHTILNFNIPISLISETASIEDNLKPFDSKTLLSLLLDSIKDEHSLKKVS